MSTSNFSDEKTQGSNNPHNESVRSDFDIISGKINALTRIDNKSYTSYSDWQKAFETYTSLLNELNASMHKNGTDEDYMTARAQLNDLYQSFILDYNLWNSKHSKIVEEKTEKTQVFNFAVFSIFMTVLTFLLSDVFIIAKTDFSVKKIIVINLSLLLILLVLFSLIGIFLGLFRNSESKKRIVLQHALLAIAIVCVSIALILVCIFMDNW